MDKIDARTYVKKKVEACGRFCASSDGICPGSLSRPGRAAMIPELMVTIKNECCYFVRNVNSLSHAWFESPNTYDDFENEEPSHQAKFQPSPLWDTLEARKQSIISWMRI
jgi:hypothetical protein